MLEPTLEQNQLGVYRPENSVPVGTATRQGVQLPATRLPDHHVDRSVDPPRIAGQGSWSQNQGDNGLGATLPPKEDSRITANVAWGPKPKQEAIARVGV